MRDLIGWAVKFLCFYWLIQAFIVFGTWFLAVNIIAGVIQLILMGALCLAAGVVIVFVLFMVLTALFEIGRSVVRNRQAVGGAMRRHWIILSGGVAIIVTIFCLWDSPPEKPAPPPVDLAYLQLKDNGFLSVMGLKVRWALQEKLKYETAEGVFLQVGPRQFKALDGRWVECL